MKKIVLVFIFLSFASGVLAAESFPQQDEINMGIVKRVENLDNLLENARKLDVNIRERLVSIAALTPKAQKQYTELAFAKLAEAEEGLQMAKAAWALAKVQKDPEHKSILLAKFAAMMQNVLTLHEEILEIVDDLEEKVLLDHLVPPKKQS